VHIFGLPVGTGMSGARNGTVQSKPGTVTAPQNTPRKPPINVSSYVKTVLKMWSDYAKEFVSGTFSKQGFHNLDGTWRKGVLNLSGTSVRLQLTVDASKTPLENTWQLLQAAADPYLIEAGFVVGGWNDTNNKGMWMFVSRDNRNFLIVYSLKGQGVNQTAIMLIAKINSKFKFQIKDEISRLNIGITDAGLVDALDKINDRIAKLTRHGARACCAACGKLIV
jgi:hypothetical protein